MNWFKKLIGWIKGIFTRPGLDQFLSKYWETALAIVANLALINSNKDFHLWKDDAWKKVQEATGELKGNWIAILVALAFESLKARNPNL